MNIEASLSQDSCVSFPEKRDVKSLLNYGWELYKLRAEVAAERRQLADLPDELLSDMGITRGDALLESRRDPGDLPQDRLAELKN